MLFANFNSISTPTIEKAKPLLSKLGNLYIPFFDVGQSKKRGFSQEFHEHRQYSPGDDLRYLDWKAFGRTDRYLIKRFDDDANASVTILLENSPRMAFAGKYDYAKLLAALITWTLLRDHKKVALATFYDNISFLNISTNLLTHWAQLVEQLDNTQIDAVQKEQSATKCFSALSQKQSVIVISDGLLDAPKKTVQAISLLKNVLFKNVLFKNTFFVQVLAKEELEFPYETITRFSHFGSTQFQDVNAKRIANAYRKEMLSHINTLKNGFAEAKIAYRLLNTEQSPLDLFR